MTKKDIKIAIFSAFAGIIFTAIYDLIKSKPILSTFWNALKWVWKNIFEFQLTVWQIILGLGFLILILYLLSKRENEAGENQIEWLSYVNDNIHNVKWSWFWEKSVLDGKWSVKDLRPICNSCGTKMHLNNTSWEKKIADCPRCEKILYEHKDLAKVESVIIDNIQRGIYPKINN